MKNSTVLLLLLIASILLLVILTGAKIPIAIYNHTGHIVSFIDPVDQDTTQFVYVLDDHTMVDESPSYDSGEDDPLEEMREADRNPNDFKNGPNGFKIHVIHEFKYREQIITGENPTICVSILSLKPRHPAEACYAAYPRTPSILDMLQENVKSNKKFFSAEAR